VALRRKSNQEKLNKVMEVYRKVEEKKREADEKQPKEMNSGLLVLAYACPAGRLLAIASCFGYETISEQTSQPS